MKLIVDTTILCRASEGNRAAIELLKNIYDKCHRVCVDVQIQNKSKILTEYRSVSGSFVSQWLMLIYSRKIRKIRIKKTCKNFLKCKRDMKFVYVCLNSQSVSTIISEDYHFVNNADELLKRGIKLYNLEDALEEFCKKQS